MALYMDTQARNTLTRATSVVFGYQKPTAINVGYGVYEPGTAATACTEWSTPWHRTLYDLPHAALDQGRRRGARRQERPAAR